MDAMRLHAYDKNTSVEVVGDRANAGECEDGHVRRDFWNIMRLCVHPGSSACHPTRVPFISPAPRFLPVLLPASNAGLPLNAIKLIPPARFLFERSILS